MDQNVERTVDSTNENDYDQYDENHHKHYDESILMRYVIDAFKEQIDEISKLL